MGEQVIAELDFVHRHHAGIGHHDHGGHRDHCAADRGHQGRDDILHIKNPIELPVQRRWRAASRGADNVVGPLPVRAALRQPAARAGSEGEGLGQVADTYSSIRPSPGPPPGWFFIML